MEDRTIEHLRKFSLILAKYSFIIGSAIFFSYMITGVPELKITGFIYSMVACTINGIFLLAMLVLIMFYPKRYWEILQSILIILFNAPVAIGYLLMATNL